MKERRAKIHTTHALPKTRRCELLDVARSTAYYRSQPVSQADLGLMRLIDEIHLHWPFYGSRRIRDELQGRGHRVNRKHVRRLMRQIDLRARYPRRRTSQPGNGHAVYPYLLRDLAIERANQVWAADTCYLLIMEWTHPSSQRPHCRSAWKTQPQARGVENEHCHEHNAHWNGFGKKRLSSVRC